ncbi:MAG: FAD-binding oxidoreductase [Deltaproteobacteria bacterium]|nr:FAD-binding oxidoreductase [Deltaproteobacteria bacterium]
MTPESWGRIPRLRPAAVVPLHWAEPAALAGRAAPILAHGLGRSYGDACLNEGGTLLLTRGLDRFLALDEAAGTLTCEAGVSLAEILTLVVPRGWFLPVVPGTQHVTVGGAIANDVHGKNHHRAGTFGGQVRWLELLRSTGEVLRCSPDGNRELFAATVGGLGLTGLVLRAGLSLRRIATTRVAAESLPLRDLSEFFAGSAESDQRFEYTVAWIDCLASGARLGRGILHRGNHAAGPGPLAWRSGSRLSVPFELPFSPLGRLTLGAFNALYHAAHRGAGARAVEARGFFFPLDGVARWNRIYGRAGFFQFQCQVPPPAAPEALRALLATIARSGQGSFLAVLKNFGAAPSPGLLSFPREGTTLALDFPDRGERTARLFRELHAVVADHRGRIYSAKDAHMSPAQFAAQHREALPAFRAQVDPAFSSSLWRRVTGG